MQYWSAVLPVSSLEPYRTMKTLASVPAYFLSPVFIRSVYVVDIAAVRMNKSKVTSPQRFVCIPQGSQRVPLTLLFQTESGFRVLVVIVIIIILIPLLHKGLIHRNELPGELSVILVDGQPAFTREKVPEAQFYLGSVNIVFVECV